MYVKRRCLSPGMQEMLPGGNKSILQSAGAAKKSTKRKLIELIKVSYILSNHDERERLSTTTTSSAQKAGEFPLRHGHEWWFLFLFPPVDLSFLECKNRRNPKPYFQGRQLVIEQK